MTIHSPRRARSPARDGDRIYAFGHPLLSLGASDMPMAESSSRHGHLQHEQLVQAVGAGTHGGFDLAGSCFRNLWPAASGAEDDPGQSQLHTSRDRIETYSYEIATDSFLTPLLLNITLFSTITSSERALGDSTISVKGEIKLRPGADSNRSPVLGRQQRCDHGLGFDCRAG